MNAYFVLKFVSVLFDILIFLIFVRVILSWIYPLGHSHGNRLVVFIFDATEPIMNLARKIPHRIGMIDISPIIAFIMLEIVQYIIVSLLQAIFFNI